MIKPVKLLLMKKPALKNLTLNGPQGALEATLSVPDETSGSVAVVCHPHPLYGGTMDNKVVHYTVRALLEMGMPVLRFNFRGVGKSAGQFDEAVGEVDDCMAVVQWIKDEYPHDQIVMAGFSFGSYIAAQVASRIEAAALVTVAPAVTLYDFNAISEINCPWLLIQGDADEVVPPEAVRTWVANTGRVSKVIWMPDASHFFHGRLLELSAHIRGWARDNL